MGTPPQRPRGGILPPDHAEQFRAIQQQLERLLELVAEGSPAKRLAPEAARWVGALAKRQLAYTADILAASAHNANYGQAEPNGLQATEGNGAGGPARGRRHDAKRADPS